MQKKSLLIILAIYLGSAVATYASFSLIGGNRVPSGSQIVQTEDGESLLAALLEIDPNAPKDQACPLNGKLFTQAEKEAWEKRRPLAVMIENTPDSRPQSGMSDADIVFEIIAEGGVTRFMGLFYCDVQRFDTTLAPIRSARTYYVDYASGFNYPLYVHVGGANVPGPTDALGQISSYGWNGENDINQFSVGYPTFVRDYNRIPGKDIATEHTMVTTTELLWEVAQERDWTNIAPQRRLGRTTVGGDDWKDGYKGWEFENTPGADGSITNISYDFWSGYDQYAVSWQYDPETNLFLRSHGGEKHIDLNNDDQVAAANVIVLLTDEKGPINEKKHMLYGTVGTGDALIFKNGEAIEATWVKKSREGELQFQTSGGKPVQFARGLTWISVVSKVTEVQY